MHKKGLLRVEEALSKLETLARYGLAVDRYREGRVSLGRAAEMAGVGDMIEMLASYGIKSNLEHEDYRLGLENLRTA